MLEGTLEISYSNLPATARDTCQRDLAAQGLNNV